MSKFLLKYFLVIKPKKYALCINLLIILITTNIFYINSQDIQKGLNEINEIQQIFQDLIAVEKKMKNKNPFDSILSDFQNFKKLFNKDILSKMSSKQAEIKQKKANITSIALNYLDKYKEFNIDEESINDLTTFSVIGMPKILDTINNNEDSGSNYKTEYQMDEIFFKFQKEMYSLTDKLEQFLNIKPENLEINNNKSNSNDNQNSKETLQILNNTSVKLFTISEKVTNQTLNDTKLLKIFNASFQEPFSILKNRQIIDFSLEGHITTILSEQDIFSLLAKKNITPNTGKIYDANVILLIKNQYLANRLIDLNAMNYYKIYYNCLLVGVDSKFENYKTSDFTAENLQNMKRPYFFIDSKSVSEILKILAESERNNFEIKVEIDYNNSNQFFPKDYLYSINYFLFVFLATITSGWVIMCWIYRRFYNLLHKWFTGLLVLKIFFCAIIICNLDVFFKKTYYSYQMDENELIDDFLKIFFETILVSLNCLFKSFFLFLFFLIFEGYKIFKDNLTRFQTRRLISIFMLFYISFCIDQFLDFDTENKVGKFILSEVKNLILFTLYLIIIQIKAYKSIQFLQRKLLYARLFVSEYQEQIKINSCRIISIIYIMSYATFTIFFRLNNTVDDNYTKHYVIIHHNFIECFMIVFLIIPYIPRKFPSNFNEFIFDNIENLVIYLFFNVYAKLLFQYYCLRLIPKIKEKINFYKVLIKRKCNNLEKNHALDNNNNSSKVIFINLVNSPKYNFSNDETIIDIKAESNILNLETEKNKIKNHIERDFELNICESQAIDNKKVKNHDFDEKCIIDNLKEYTKLKKKISSTDLRNQKGFKKDFPILILNPGYEAADCPTEKICIGSII